MRTGNDPGLHRWPVLKMKVALALVILLHLVSCSFLSKRKDRDYLDKESQPRKRVCRERSRARIAVPQENLLSAPIEVQDAIETNEALYGTWLATPIEYENLSASVNSLVNYYSGSYTAMITYLPLIYAGLEKVQAGLGWETLFGDEFLFNFSVPTASHTHMDLEALFEKLEEKQLVDVAKMLVLLQHSFLITGASFDTNSADYALNVNYLNTILLLGLRSKDRSLKRAIAFTLGFYLRNDNVKWNIENTEHYRQITKQHFVEVFMGYKFGTGVPILEARNTIQQSLDQIFL